MIIGLVFIAEVFITPAFHERPSFTMKFPTLESCQWFQRTFPDLSPVSYGNISVSECVGRDVAWVPPPPEPPGPGHTEGSAP